MSAGSVEPVPVPGRAAGAPEATPVPRLAGDALRQIVATSVMTVSVVAMTGALVWWAIRADRAQDVLADRLGMYLSLMFPGLTLYSTLYVVLTVVVLSRARGEGLRRWLLAVDPDRNRRQRLMVLLAGGGSLAYGVSMSLLAIAAVLVLILRPELTGPGPVVVGAVSTVVGAWCVVMCVFAVRYAQLWARGSGVVFPEESDPHEREHERRFADFVYLAVQVSTTFSSSDVSLVSPTARRAVMAHSILAFAFNTVIIALLVSVVVSR